MRILKWWWWQWLAGWIRVHSISKFKLSDKTEKGTDYPHTNPLCLKKKIKPIPIKPSWATVFPPGSYVFIFKYFLVRKKKSFKDGFKGVNLPVSIDPYLLRYKFSYRSLNLMRSWFWGLMSSEVWEPLPWTSLFLWASWASPNRREGKWHPLVADFVKMLFAAVLAWYIERLFVLHPTSLRIDRSNLTGGWLLQHSSSWI